MGALEINPKKRDVTHTTFNHKLDASISSVFSETNVVKKPRFAPDTPDVSQHRRVALKSSTSRVLEYPGNITRFKRPVHAPCRGKKFKFFKANYRNYVTTKKEAFATIRFCGKGKEVIAVDDVEVIDTGGCTYGGLEGQQIVDVDDVEAIDTGDCKDGVLGDEEVEVVEKGKGKLWECDEVIEVNRGVEELNCQPSCSSVISEDLVGGNLKVDGGEKGLEIVERREDLDGTGGPLHEKLKKSVEKRNQKLGIFDFLIAYFNKKLSALQSFRPAKKPAKVFVCSVVF